MRGLEFVSTKETTDRGVTCGGDGRGNRGVDLVRAILLVGEG